MSERCRCGRTRENHNGVRHMFTPAFPDEEDPTGSQTGLRASRVASIFADLDPLRAERLFKLCAAWSRLDTERQILLERSAELLNVPNVNP